MVHCQAGGKTGELIFILFSVSSNEHLAWKSVLNKCSILPIQIISIEFQERKQSKYMLVVKNLILILFLLFPCSIITSVITY